MVKPIRGGGIRSDLHFWKSTVKNGLPNCSEIFRQFLNSNSEHFLFFGDPPRTPPSPNFWTPQRILGGGRGHI